MHPARASASTRCLFDPVHPNTFATHSIPQYAFNRRSGIVCVGRAIPSEFDFDPIVGTSFQPFKVAILPFLSHIDEFDVAETATLFGPGYQVKPKGTDVLMERIKDATAILVGADVDFAVLPEYILSVRDARPRWRRCLSEYGESQGKLRWVLVGSGPIRPGDGVTNTAMIVRAGKEHDILEQAKRSAFNIRQDRIDAWCMTPMLPTPGAHIEDIVLGDTLTVIESDVGRIVVLIYVKTSTRILVSTSFSSLSLRPTCSCPFFLGKSSLTSREQFEWIDAACLRKRRAAVVVSNSLAITNSRLNDARKAPPSGPWGTCSVSAILDDNGDVQDGVSTRTRAGPCRRSTITCVGRNVVSLTPVGPRSGLPSRRPGVTVS